ncbi:MAG TPA: patatin-like phospholipase family protein, partial [Nitrospiraceae bacterium]|nr:patatin-like phospholipase family protein [Nitrospiraceae bacterium]
LLVLWLAAPVLLPMLLIGRAVYAKWKSPRALTSGQWMLRRVLAQFDLDREVADAYPLKQFLIRLFDPGYYGPLLLHKVVARALSDDTKWVGRGKGTPKTLGTYAEDSEHCRGIHVAPIVTNLADGRSMVPPPTTKVVKALLAAVAVVPFFKPVRIGGAKCIDAVNVSNEPSLALLDYLRDKVHNASAVYVYPVAAFPTTTSALPNGTAPYTGLVDIMLRVRELSRCRQVNLERKLTKLYTRLLPADTARHVVEGQAFLSAHLFPVEPEKPLRVNERLAEAEEAGKEQIIFETIAAGCRAMLEVLISQELKSVQSLVGNTMTCREALARLQRAPNPLPGSNRDGGPGLAEICPACSLKTVGPRGEVQLGPQSLRILPDRQDWPKWPHKDEDEKNTKDANAAAVATEPVYSSPPVPKADKSCSDNSPWVSVLFSGGVFRGVFQVGVLNALEQADVAPRLFAGSSVGSIMAAMAARLFDEPKQTRPARMADLAATFLALDRLILTDRFADFARRITIRAASTRLSFHDLDRLFRRYDAAGPDHFSTNSRRVVAGLERLLYVSPFELTALVRSVRLQQRSEAYKLIRRYLQEFLERYDTGLEILGAEPLELLIAEHVLQSGRYYRHPRRAPFDLFQHHAGSPKYVLATATNLTTGALKIIGEHALQPNGAADGDPQAMLLDSLLASSAFPGIFRPRRSSEVFPHDQHNHQYVDGGVMDNLPLDAVVHFLDSAAQAGKLARRPQNGEVPHLLLTASLEPELDDLDRKQVTQICSSWPLLLRRTRQLSYNNKIDSFAKAQRHFRTFYNQRSGGDKWKPLDDGWEPLDIEVVTVKAKWLCPTYGFHPMLGFRRTRQAASIAHGCASTLLQLHYASLTYPKAWGISLQFDQQAIVKGKKQLVPNADRKKAAQGLCWFRSDGAVCPFSNQGLKKLAGQGGNHNGEETRQALHGIYEVCGRPETHVRQ